jgi:hypothetical protein
MLSAVRSLSLRHRPTRRVGLPLLAALVTLAVLVGGCDSRFEDVNANPNEPEDVPPGLLLPNIIRSAVNTSVNESFSTGNLVAQYTAKVSFATDIDRYDWSGVGYWNAYYDDLRNVEEMIRIAQAQERPNVEGVGLVLKSWIFSMLTDAYGDVPYSESLRVLETGENTPAYDAQEAIYRGLLADLEAANRRLDPARAQPVQGDILYDGDVLKWKKLANALRLRLLMRLSEKQGAIEGVDVAGTFQAIVADPAQYPVFTTNADNAALAYLTSRPNEWPVHTIRVGSFRTYRMSQTLTSQLKALDDPRLSTFADPTVASVDAGTPAFEGVPNGLTDDASNEYNGGRDFQSSLNTTRYFESPNAAQGLIMTYAEVLFLRAEAAARGWTAEDAQSLYESGIAASMTQYGQSVPSGYLEQDAVRYPTGDAERAIAQINRQKWIALFFTGLEGWFNWRRTGVPALEPSVSNVNSDRIPVRFRYPESEQSLNAENYQKAVDTQGADNINTAIWLIE